MTLGDCETEWITLGDVRTFTFPLAKSESQNDIYSQGSCGQRLFAIELWRSALFIVSVMDFLPRMSALHSVVVVGYRLKYVSLNAIVMNFLRTSISQDASGRVSRLASLLCMRFDYLFSLLLAGWLVPNSQHWA